MRRGFDPVKTRSFHWLADPAFSVAIREYLDREREWMEDYFRQAERQLPYKSTSEEHDGK